MARATLVRTVDDSHQIWRITDIDPKNPKVSYGAVTYPNSDRLFIVTGARKRPVSEATATKVGPAIRAAIDQAKKDTTS